MGDEETMPRNVVGVEGGRTADAGGTDAAEAEELWRARNLPAETTTFRWRYANGEVQLYERRLRSLRAHNVGPAVQAWVRSRLEWVIDNKLHEQPDGVVVLSIDPEGDVAIELEPPREPVEGVGTLWAADGGRLVAYAEGGELRHAADTLARDLATTLGFRVEVAGGGPGADRAEAFWVSDEFGVVPCADAAGGPVTEKMAGCFEKLWS